MSVLTRARFAMSLLLGIATILLSYWMPGFLLLASAMIGFPDLAVYTGQPWRRFVFDMTGQEPLGYLLLALILATAIASPGLRLVFDQPWRRRAGLLGASAARSCVIGLLGVGLNIMVLSVFMAYRWLN